MKRLISIFILVATLSMAFSSSTLAITDSKSKKVGSYQYVVRTITTNLKRVPIYETQAEHTKGYQTMITV